jgi:hypothetical protein
MNWFSKAIKQDEIIPFFQGKVEYFDLDRDRGQHDPVTTYMHIIEYGKQFGERAMYNQLNIHLIKYLNIHNFSKQDLEVVLGVIWNYLIYRKEKNVFTEDWSIETKIVHRLQRYINELCKVEDCSNVLQTLSNMKLRFNFDLLQ